MIAYGGGILFQAIGDDDAGTLLWELGVHDASATAPQPVPISPAFPAAYTELNGLLYLLAGQLWRTDGTVAGTVQVTGLAGDVIVRLLRRREDRDRARRSAVALPQIAGDGE
jgi:hypothetical protein